MLDSGGTPCVFLGLVLHSKNLPDSYCYSVQDGEQTSTDIVFKIWFKRQRALLTSLGFFPMYSIVFLSHTHFCQWLELASRKTQAPVSKVFFFCFFPLSCSSNQNINHMLSLLANSREEVLPTYCCQRNIKIISSILLKKIQNQDGIIPKSITSSSYVVFLSMSQVTYSVFNDL